MRPKGFKLLLGVLLVGALFVRLYRLDELLGFWYDQGRDALVIWDFTHKGKLFLVGPMMGATGIFRGPWYYWLIAPLYLAGRGDPLWPAYFLILTSVISIFVLYKVGKEVGGVKAGLIAAFVASVSYYVVGASRWLSNPTPMLLVSTLLIWAVFRFLEKKVWSLPLIALLIGLGLSFGAATELFYIPAMLIIILMKKNNIPKPKVILLSLFLFFSTFLPQVIFEIRHRGVLFGAINKFLVEEKSFTLSFWEYFRSRLSFFYGLFSSKFWIDGKNLFTPFFLIIVGYLIGKWKEIWGNEKFRVVLIFATAPFLGTLFLRGNQGNIYEYYYTGYYLIFILLFSVILARMSEKFLGKAILAFFLIVVSIQNYHSFQKDFSVSLASPNAISYKNQLSAIDWIYTDAGSAGFNVDVYVPPVIPYAYDYLFKWLGTEKYKKLPVEELVSTLYTLYEVDPDHPERLDAWLSRQEKIGQVVKSERFGGIVVQKRLRLIYE